MITQLATKQRLRAEAKKRISILAMGLILGLVFIFGAFLFQAMGYDGKVSRQAVWCLIAISFVSSFIAFFGELWLKGNTPPLSATNHLNGHATYSTISFISSSYALCLVIVTVARIGFWTSLLVACALVIALLLVNQGLKFALEAVKQSKATY